MDTGTRNAHGQTTPADTVAWASQPPELSKNTCLLFNLRPHPIWGVLFRQSQQTNASAYRLLIVDPNAALRTKVPLVCTLIKAPRPIVQRKAKAAVRPRPATQAEWLLRLSQDDSCRFWVQC